MNRYRFQCLIFVLLCLPSETIRADDKTNAADRQTFLKRFDTNRDGKITREEAKAVLERESKQRTAKAKADASRTSFLKRFDANGDGRVTREEAQLVLEREARKRRKTRK